MITLTIALVSKSVLAGPVEVPVPIEHIYAPHGFDANDNTEVVIEGMLPNLCHKAPKVNFEIKGKVIDIELKASKFQDNGQACAEVLVPFIETVDLGLLDKGLYEIKVNGKTAYETNSSIKISESSSDAIDDYIYANIESIEETDKPNIVLLKGHNPSDCFVYDRTESFNNKSDTYSILPVMRQVSGFCPKKLVPFSIEYEIPKELKRDKVLLHVRSMMGRSVNKLKRFNIE